MIASIAWLLLSMALPALSGAPPETGDAAAVARPDPNLRPAVTGLLVAEEDDRPLAGATVEAFLDPDPDMARERLTAGDPIGAPLAGAPTDVSGRFRLALPEATRLVVVARGKGRMRWRILGPTLLAADRDLGVVTVAAGRTVTGRVVDAGGRPIGGAVVVAWQITGSRRPWESGRRPFPATARTAADGSFAIEGAPRETLTLSAFHDGFAPARADLVRRDTGVEIRLVPGVPVTGRVAGPDGAPVPGAWVLAGDEGRDGVTRADANGAFRLARVRPGALSLVAVGFDPGACGETTSGAARSRCSLLAPSAPVAITIGAKSPGAVTLMMRPGGLVSVRVLDEETRRPIAAALVTITAGGSPPAPRLTDRDGAANFPGMPVGPLSADAEADGYLDDRPYEVVLAAGQTRDVTLALLAGAAVTGLVLDDLGRPIAAAAVAVSGPPPWMRRYQVGRMFMPIGLEPVETDARGRFAFTLLPPKCDLKLRAAHTDNAPNEITLRLMPGEKRAGIEIRLAPGTVINGRIVDRGGAAVAGAAVTAGRRAEDTGVGSFTRYGGRDSSRPAAPGRAAVARAAETEGQVPAAVAGADGAFRVTGIVAGIWSLAIAAPGFAPKTIDGLKVEEPGGLDTGAVTLEPGARLAGRIVGPTGEPVALARGELGRGFDVLAEFVTGADGGFAIDDLPPDEPVNLEVTADGYGRHERSGLAPPVEDLVIRLAPASSLSGTVVDAESKQPVRDVTISVSRSRSVGGSSGFIAFLDTQAERTFHTDDGAFLFEDISPGHLMLTAAAAGYRSGELNDIEVPEGGRRDGVVVMLARAVTLSGTVTDEGDRPVVGAMVRRQETASGTGMRMTAVRTGFATTDGVGAFRLEGLEPGSLVLTASHSEYETATIDIDAGRDREGVRIRMAPAATLTGTVRREADGSPVAGAEVSAQVAGEMRYPSPTAATRSDGSFALEGLSSGRWTVSARAPGLGEATLDSVLVSRGVPPAPVEIRIGGGVTLTGTLTGVAEEKRARFTVLAVGSGDRGFRGPTPVDAAGRFAFRGMTTGSVIVTASSEDDGVPSVTRRIEIPEGVETYEVTIEIPTGSAVRGTIRRGDRPVGGASIRFRSAAARSSVADTTDASGAYAIAGVARGENAVNVWQLSQGLSYSTTVEIDGDRTLDIAMPMARIAGVVRDAVGGQPLAGVSVRAESAESGGAVGIFQQSAGTDASGAYRIEGLDGGRYTVTARREGYGFESRSVTISDPTGETAVEFELQRADALMFKVVDGLSGLPLHSVAALVQVGGGDPLDPAAPPATTLFQGSLAADAADRFHLDSLQPGSYRLALAAMGLAGETIHALTVPTPMFSVTLAPGGTIAVRAPDLPAGTTARLALLDASGRPIHLGTWNDDRWLYLRPGQPTMLTDVKPGSYRVRAALPAGVVEKTVQVTAGTTTSVSLP